MGWVKAESRLRRRRRRVTTDRMINERYTTTHLALWCVASRYVDSISTLAFAQWHNIAVSHSGHEKPRQNERYKKPQRIGLILFYRDGSFHSWINVWVAGKTVWTPCHLARYHAAGHYSLNVSVGQTAFHFISFLPTTLVAQEVEL